MVTGNCISDWDLPLSSLLPCSSSRKRRRICAEGKTPPPPTQISKLGEDLLVEILIRLPNPKSAGRSKAVCKLWSSLISDPGFDRRFVSHHRSRNERGPPPPLLFSDDPHSILSFLPVADEDRRDLVVWDSFKDLILCGFEDSIDAEPERSYFICNPFTKQWIALPLAPRNGDLYVVLGDRKKLAARLVCEPRSSSISNNHNLAHEPLAETTAFVYSEYQFRVVCMYQLRSGTAMDVFSSESGRWKKQALVLYDQLRLFHFRVVSWNSELFWMYRRAGDPRSLRRFAVFNPFRLNTPLTSLNVPSEMSSEMAERRGNLSISQGTAHIILLGVEGPGSRCSRGALSVWRLEEGGKSWSKLYEMALRNPTLSSSPYICKYCQVLDLHPEKPEIVLLAYLNYPDTGILSCNLRTGEVEMLAEPMTCYLHNWRVFQPRVSCWPTPIPRYEKLRGYNGSKGTLRRCFKKQKKIVRYCGIG
ncbi:unnamed protein product [Linum tenue]|uniref:F-box protein At3g26010-like beta-propeller domain-containing protein n=1 Tax=Linum tenue TaxID=586396 RepID=A0AAV0MTN4_9ROSI|nr:unnamed protein product [Linum tenue]